MLPGNIPICNEFCLLFSTGERERERERANYSLSSPFLISNHQNGELKYLLRTSSPNKREDSGVISDQWYDTWNMGVYDKYEIIRVWNFKF